MPTPSIRASGRSASCSSSGFERVWIALHGPGGEDGTLQGALEYLGVPYTGSGVMGSAIGMDKLRTKRLALAVGVPTADFVVLRGAQDFELALERLGLPLIVKPATQGSSVGMSKVERADGTAGGLRRGGAVRDAGVRRALDHGPEYTVAILQGEALPSIRIETPQDLLRLRGQVLLRTTRATSVPRGCRGQPRSTWRSSRSPRSRPAAPPAGDARIS